MQLQRIDTIFLSVNYQFARTGKFATMALLAIAIFAMSPHIFAMFMMTMA
jgi:hypothetical protein